MHCNYRGLIEVNQTLFAVREMQVIEFFILEFLGSHIIRSGCGFSSVF
jgi:hypothetical protein